MTKEKPTKEELLSTKPPEDVIAELKSFSDSQSVPMEEIKKSFHEILSEPYLDNFSIEDRCRQASKILLAQIASKFSSATASFEFQVIDKTSIKKIIKEVEEEDPATGQMVKVKKETYLGKVFGLFGGAGDDSEKYSTKLGVVTTWNDACQSLAQFQKDQTYMGKFSVTEHEEFYELTMNDPQTCEKTNTELGDTKDIITNFFTAIPVSQAQYNLGTDRGDYKLLIGRVRSSRISLNKKGNNMGWLDLLDENMNITDLQEQDNMKISCMFMDAPEFATRYLTGSLVYVLTELSASEEWGISAFAQLVIPIMGIPALPETPTPVPTPQGQAEVPVESPVQQPDVPVQGETTPEIPTPPSTDTQTTKPESVPDPAQTQGW